MTRTGGIRGRQKVYCIAYQEDGDKEQLEIAIKLSLETESQCGAVHSDEANADLQRAIELSLESHVAIDSDSTTYQGSLAACTASYTTMCM